MFTLLLAVISAMLAGLVPALQASRTAVREHLQEGDAKVEAAAAAAPAAPDRSRDGAGLRATRGRRRPHADAVEHAAGRSWLQSGPRGGDDPEPARALFAGPNDVRSFYTRLLERVRTMPGVESAATATGVLQPLVTNSGIYSIEGKPDPPAGQRIEYPVEIVSPGFFETLQDLTRRRTHLYRPGPRRGASGGYRQRSLRDAGVAGPGPPGQADEARLRGELAAVDDGRRGHQGRAPGGGHAGHPAGSLPAALQVTPPTQMLLVRTAGDPLQILPMVRREVQTMNPQLPLFATGTLDAGTTRHQGQRAGGAQAVITCDLRGARCDVRRAMCDVRGAMCDVRGPHP